MRWPHLAMHFSSRSLAVLCTAGILLGGSGLTATAQSERPAATVGAAPFIDHFEVLDKRKWYIADYVNRAGWFATAWDKKLVTHFPERDRVDLAIDATAKAGKAFRGGELQRRGFFGYGRYEVVMKAGRGSGTVSSFFTYTGPAFKSPHHEIDFEFLGRNTNKVWLNVFTDGKELPGKWMDLGFDAASAPHLYAFEWRPDSITWFVDGKEFFHLTSKDKAIPHLAGKIMMNAWVGSPGQRGWLGQADRDTKTWASYYCVSYRPFETEAAQCGDTFEGAHARQ